MPRHRAHGASATLCILSVLFAGEANAAAPVAPDPLLATLVDRATRAGFGQTLDLFVLSLSAQAGVAPLDDLAVALREQHNPRTDQQTGTSSSAAGSTTLTDKPGIADLLSLAIERGAITKTTSDTTFSLQTTPYLFYTHFGGRDDATNWDRLTALRHVALAATFAATNTTQGGGLSNFQSAEAKYVALGSLSARDRAFRDHIRATLASMLVREGESLRSTTRRSAHWLATLSMDTRQALDYAAITFTNWQTDAIKPIPTADVYRRLNELLEPVRTHLSTAETSELAATAISIVAEETARANLGKAIATEAKEWIPAGPQLSIVYGFNRDATTSDYSRVKLLFGYDSGERFSFNANAEVSLNHAHDAGTSHIRAYAGEASLTLGRFAHNVIDLTAAAKVEYAKINAQRTTALQAKANLYLVSAITVPLALTYANHTEDSPKSKLRLNIGLSLNADALLGVARAK